MHSSVCTYVDACFAPASFCFHAWDPGSCSNSPRFYQNAIAELEVGSSAVTTSGLVQFLACVGLLIYRYLHFGADQVFGGTQMALKAAEQGGETAIMRSGLFVLAAYLLQTATIFLMYLAGEGAVRLIAANTAGEVLPNGVLAGIACIHGKLSSTASEVATGARVVDQVEVLGADGVKLRIRSCRPKSTWDQRITILYNDELCELAGTEEGTAPRRYVYPLRTNPPSKIVRGTYQYTPNEALTR